MSEEEELIKKFKEHARKHREKLNKKKIVEFVVKGLIERKEKYGEYYCPCRVVSGDKKEDEKIICPCAYHEREVREDGRCLCGLFMKKQSHSP